METFVGIVFIIVCVLLIIVVLLQKGRGGGLGAAFGGAGSSAFGTRTGDVFTWITIVLTVMFLLLAVGATLLYRPGTGNVLPPKMIPASGSAIAEEGQDIIIICETKGARIAYTTNGTEPVDDPKENAISVQRATVFVTPGQTIKARAFADKRNPSERIIATYERAEPTAPPVPPISTQPATKPAPTTQPAGGS